MPSFRIAPPSGATLCTALAFDPGETTGWCALSVEPEALLEASMGDLWSNVVEADYGQIPCGSRDVDDYYSANVKHAGLNMAGENRGIAKMVDYATYWDEAAIVIEDFIPDPGRFDQARHTLSPVRLMAGFSYGISQQAGVRGVQRIFVQDRVNPKTTCTDARLRRWGLLDSSSGAHARDATRHAYYFLRNCNGNGDKALQNRHLAWPHLFADPDISIRAKSRSTRLGEII